LDISTVHLLHKITRGANHHATIVLSALNLLKQYLILFSTIKNWNMFTVWLASTWCLVIEQLAFKTWKKVSHNSCLQIFFNNYNIISINNLDLHDNDQLIKVRCWFNSIVCKGGLNMFCPEILLALVYFKIGLRSTHMFNKGLIWMRYSIHQELLRINIDLFY
jgi:hypothetical protein